MEPLDDQRQSARRAADEIRVWLPLLISMLTTLFTVGMFYGKLNGRLDLIEYRLHRIELGVGLEK